VLSAISCSSFSRASSSVLIVSSRLSLASLPRLSREILTLFLMSVIVSLSPKERTGISDSLSCPAATRSFKYSCYALHNSSVASSRVNVLSTYS
jgi:hypothetical protein